MRKYIYLISWVLTCSSLADDMFTTQREQVLALGRLTSPPAVQPAEGYASTDNLKAVYYDALNWKGTPTKVFAWLGFPENRTGKVPGIVLIHGGGGTAYKEWVQLWNARGFAAIAIAVEGQTDVPVSKNVWVRHGQGGPKRIGIYADSDKPLQDQWMYHAVADTVLANSLLRSLPEVDADNVGIMGISWGGVITATAIGIDHRFAFAIPTYGCGHLFDAQNKYGDALGTDRMYREVWDPYLRMSQVHIPVLWLSWPEDPHFPMDCLVVTYCASPGYRMVSLIPGMGHSHPKAWTPPDSYAFAESIVENGMPWCRQLSQKNVDREVSVDFSSVKPLDRAILVSTTDNGFTGDREWIESSASISRTQDGWRATAHLPDGTAAWFINVFSGELTVSSDYQAVTDSASE